MAAAAILDCRIHKILFADGIWREETHHCTKFLSKSVVPLRRYRDFRIFKVAVAAILNVWNRENLLVTRVQRVETHQQAKFRQNRSIGCKVIKIFWIFQDSGRRHLVFSKSWIFICWRYLEGSDASLYKTLSKLVVPLQRYCDFSNFQDGGRPPSWICLGHIWTTNSEYLGVSITLQNLVMIDAAVFIMWTFQYLARSAGKCLFTSQKMWFLGNFIH